VAIGTTDPVGWALAIDALDHPGPASPARIDRKVCTEPALPGVSPTGSLEAVPAVPYLTAAATPLNLVGVKKLGAEPPLRCYVFAACQQTRRLPRARGRLAGTTSRPTLTLSVAAPSGEPPLRALRIVLPGTLSIAPGAAQRLRVLGGATVATMRREIVLRARIPSARRISLRAGAGTLRGTRSRRVVLRLHTTDALGLTATVRLLLRR
jgi:hypothetical protein